MSEFYDQMASLYHLIFPNWEESIERQATQFSSIIYERWPGAETILDVSCGIGTQSIGLAKRGFTVTASDLSDGAVARGDDDLLLALRQIHACTRPGGGCLFTVRDYDQEERGTGLVKPYGVREEDGKRYLIFQVWDFVDQVYDMAMYFVTDDGVSEPATHVMRTRYNAVGTDHLLALMREAGFASTERIDGQFYQPVLIGNREVETTKTV